MSCTRYIDCNKRESWESLFKRLIVEQPDGTLAVRTCCEEAEPVCVDAPAPGNITVTPDDVGSNPVTWYYVVCYIDGDNTERSLFSTESSYITGDATTNLTVSCDIQPSWSAYYAFNSGTVSGIYDYCNAFTDIGSDISFPFDPNVGCYENLLALPVHQDCE